MFRILFATALLASSGSFLKGQEEFSTVPAYKTSTPPLIDGEIDASEWEDAGPAIMVSPDVHGFGNLIDEDPFGGADDLSFQFRVMWAEPWTAYFLYEVFDDVEMSDTPENPWEADQIEVFIDGRNHLGSSEAIDFHWWEGDDPQTYGKFAVGRDGVFDGNFGVMSEFEEDLQQSPPSVLAAAAASPTGQAANYVIEMAVSFEKMFLDGGFEGTSTQVAEQIVANETSLKYTVAAVDNDNFDNGETQRSSTLTYYRENGGDWDISEGFADLLFLGEFNDQPAQCGDFDLDGDIDAADLTRQTVGWTGALASGGTAVFEDGDCDGDGDVDTADQTGLVSNWTGAMAGNLTDGADADLVYDPSNGNVTLDASDTNSGQLISFVVGTDANDMDTSSSTLPFIDVGTNTDNTPFQIGQTDPLNQGAGPQIDLGNILPVGMDLQSLSDYLTIAEYASELGQGGTLDLVVVPEANASLMALLGLLACFASVRCKYLRMYEGR